MAVHEQDAFRLAEGGRLIDRAHVVTFRFNGEELKGYRGDTLASALLANGRRFVGRSFKYHRPRGFVASGVEEPNGLFGIGEGGRFEPNQRGTMVEIHPGLTAVSQNHFPSLEWDLGAVNAYASRFLPAGFYYKTFLKPRAAWKHVFEPFIRRAAGLGKAPTEADPDDYEQFHLSVDVLVAGGGIAGVLAAKAAAESGARVLLVEQNAWLGGRALIDGVGEGAATVDGRPLARRLEEEIADLAERPNVVIRTRTQLSCLEDHNYALLYERVTDHGPADGEGAPRHRLWRVRAQRVIAAAGAIERPLAFAYNDLPGVMLASAVRDYLGLYGVSPGERTVVFANNDDAYRTALALLDAGREVAMVVDPREGAEGDLAKRVAARGVPIRFGAALARAVGKKGVEAVEVAPLRGTGRVGAVERVACDCVAMSGGWSPSLHLFSQVGGKVVWDEAQALFRPDEQRAPSRWDGAPSIECAGAANGRLGVSEGALDALSAGAAAAAGAGFAVEAGAAPEIAEPEEAGIAPLWFAPAAGDAASGRKHFIDFQNDVTAADVELAAREGYESVEHAKRYTTLGMATDQGKLSNVNGLAILADARRASIPEVGVTTFRPPYTPISFGAIAGSRARELFKPVRKTPLHAWHEAQRAVFEPVGEWRRPYSFPRPSGPDDELEDLPEAVNREILNVREGVGALDASTLGKLIVSGPDAGAFLDLVYTNMMSTLKPGRCRYGLMCNDNGFLFDDGVVVRLDDGSGGPEETKFLCHTTSGGLERVQGWLEEWLQTEWPHLKVHVANVTEQWAQIAVAGPKARALLEKLTDLDLSAEALPFMAWTAGEIAGCPARIYRISFSGELSYEIAVPAAYGLSFWETLFEAGAEFDIQPYGTEALHVMRAEKGFIMIGDETDGTVTPLDLDLGWAVSKKKADFIGKRAMARPFLQAPERWRLVGFLTEDPEEVLPDGAYCVEGERMQSRRFDKTPMARPQTIGRVTSSYWSPTLGRSIALGLIERGLDRKGEIASFPVEAGKTLRAEIVDPVFYDPDNARQAL